jgi:hypothetical protein
LRKTNVNERFSQQEVIIIIKLFLSIIFNGFPLLTFPVCIVLIFRSPEKRWIEVSLYMKGSVLFYSVFVKGHVKLFLYGPVVFQSSPQSVPHFCNNCSE